MYLKEYAGCTHNCPRLIPGFTMGRHCRDNHHIRVAQRLNREMRDTHDIGVPIYTGVAQLRGERGTDAIPVKDDDREAVLLKGLLQCLRERCLTRCWQPCQP